MTNRAITAVLLLVLFCGHAAAQARGPDSATDILVTFENEGLRSFSAAAGEPYRKRKRYAIDPEVRRHAADIARDYALVEVDRWPIRSLSVFCFVYRLPAEVERDAVIERLRADPRVESAQPVQRYETLNERVASPASAFADYDDTYVTLQHALTAMEIPAAHRHSRGRGVRVAIVDGLADANHEDLKGRLTETRFIAESERPGARDHGTAVASVIGANANNAVGIVGVAPESTMELYVACWTEDGMENSVCDSFTLAKALDAVVASGPAILNLSLTGPFDPLLERLLLEVDRKGVVIIAARPADERDGAGFPASLPRVIAVGNSDNAMPTVRQVHAGGETSGEVYAPGQQIMVALPDNAYDFRSGSSLSAAHVSGVVALLIAVSPDARLDAIRAVLRESQRNSPGGLPSVNACLVLQLAGRTGQCSAF